MALLIVVLNFIITLSSSNEVRSLLQIRLITGIGSLVLSSSFSPSTICLAADFDENPYEVQSQGH